MAGVEGGSVLEISYIAIERETASLENTISMCLGKEQSCEQDVLDDFIEEHSSRSKVTMASYGRHDAGIMHYLAMQLVDMPISSPSPSAAVRLSSWRGSCQYEGAILESELPVVSTTSLQTPHRLL